MEPIVAQSSTRAGERTVTVSQAGILVIAAYVAAQILADVGSLKIAWVAGFGISDEFKVTRTTKRVLKLQLING